MATPGCYYVTDRWIALSLLHAWEFGITSQGHMCSCRHAKL
uniref:Uncharacterized protein n=1 Tax=Arundo donax TaxID=35708 RepID=A0A0A9CQ75_ARUDO